MAARADLFDLARLALRSGEGRRLDLSVRVDPLQFGDERYEAAPVDVPVVLDVSRMTHDGWSLRLRFEVRLTGPCMRCLGAAQPPFTVDAREVDQAGGGDELSSPYVDEAGVLDVGAWARDALVLALPAQIVCRDECAGLCPECGSNLNEAGPDHGHERAPDPRWAALRDLRLE